MSAFALAVSVLLVIVYRFYVSRKLAYHALFDIYRSQKPVTDFTSDQGNTGAINKSTEDNDQIPDIQEISNKLNHLLVTEKVFRDKFLSSERLAEKLGISRRELSTYLQNVHNQALTTEKPFTRPSG